MKQEELKEDKSSKGMPNFDFDAEFTQFDSGMLEEKEWNSDQIGYDFLKDE